MLPCFQHDLKSEIIISKLFCFSNFYWPTHLADLTNFILGDTITIATCLTLFKMKQQNLLRMDFDSIAQFLQQDICNVNCTDDQLFLYIQKGLIWNFFYENFISQNFFFGIFIFLKCWKNVRVRRFQLELVGEPETHLFFFLPYNYPTQIKVRSNTK